VKISIFRRLTWICVFNISKIDDFDRFWVLVDYYIGLRTSSIWYFLLWTSTLTLLCLKVFPAWFAASWQLVSSFIWLCISICSKWSRFAVETISNFGVLENTIKSLPVLRGKGTVCIARRVVHFKTVRKHHKVSPEKSLLVLSGKGTVCIARRVVHFKNLFFHGYLHVTISYKIVVAGRSLVDTWDIGIKLVSAVQNRVLKTHVFEKRFSENSENVSKKIVFRHNKFNDFRRFPKIKTSMRAATPSIMPPLRRSLRECYFIDKTEHSKDRREHKMAVRKMFPCTYLF